MKLLTAVEGLVKSALAKVDLGKIPEAAWCLFGALSSGSARLQHPLKCELLVTTDFPTQHPLEEIVIRSKAMDPQNEAATDLAGNNPTPSAESGLESQNTARLNTAEVPKDGPSPTPESTQKKSSETVDDKDTEPQDPVNTLDLSVPKFRVVEREGNIFDAPDHSVLIHACNCFGVWGAGIAAAFKDRYPKAYRQYYRLCKYNSPDELVGTALLIRPSEKRGRKHYVACLFTSRLFGLGRDSPEQILKYTEPAMEDLMEQIAEVVRKGGTVSEIRTCHINSGIFSVPWERSKAIMEDLEIPEGFGIHEITAWTPAQRL